MQWWVSGSSNFFFLKAIRLNFCGTVLYKSNVMFSTDCRKGSEYISKHKRVKKKSKIIPHIYCFLMFSEVTLSRYFMHPCLVSRKIVKIDF